LGYTGALALTVAVELLVASALSPRELRRRALATCLLVNLTTHPLATLLVLRSSGFLSIEAAVVLAELAAYIAVARLPTGRAAAIALVGNVATALFGLLYWT